MKNFNKILSVALTVLLVLTLVIFPIGCWDNDNPPSDKNDVDNSTIIGGSNDNEDKTDIPNGTDKPDDSTDKPDNDNKPSEDVDEFEDYGMNVITVRLDNVNVTEKGIYNTKEEVGAYIYLFHKLPSNYNSNKSYVTKNYTKQNKLSYTGGTFQNREGLLPKASGRTFPECDIGYTGGGRNALRIVFSSDFLIFYTGDHYDSFSIMRFV